MLNESQKQALAGKLSPKHVKTRKQAGITLSYVEGWWVISEANRIFGFDGWTRETVSNECVWTGTVNNKPSCTYNAKVRISIDGVTRDGCGTGHGTSKNPGDAHESAYKEAETDAMKRALMTFGNPFGLALYDKGQANVGEPEPTEDDIALCKTLIMAIESATTVEDLQAWASEPEHKTALDGLPEKLKAQARDVFQKKMNQLKG